MRIAISFFALLLHFTCQSQGAPEIISESNKLVAHVLSPLPTKEGIKVPTYSKLEVGIVLPEKILRPVRNFTKKIRGTEELRINPFDPDEIRVQCEFFSENSGRLVSKGAVEGFYYEQFKRKKTGGRDEDSYWDEDLGNKYYFRIRSAWGSTGRFIAIVKLQTRDTLMYSDTIAFDVIESSSHGRVVIGNENNYNDRYLRFEDGSPFIPIAETIGYQDWSQLRASHHRRMDEWISSFVANGINTIRLWSNVGSFLIEREALGDYSQNYSPAYNQTVNRMTNAWELDQVVERCERDEIFIQFINFGSEMDNHGETPYPLNWFYNPYKRELGLKHQSEWYTDSLARVYQKRRLRYQMARWGYSSKIFCYEIIGEPCKWGADLKGEIKELETWLKDLSDYMKSQQPWECLTLTNFVYANNDNDWRRNYTQYTGLDFMSSNSYGEKKDINWNHRWTVVQKMQTNKKGYTLKFTPFLYSEIGTAYPTLEFATDIEMHNSLWATAFNGSCGPANQYWWQRHHIADNNTMFHSVAEYFKGVDLTKGNFQPYKHKHKWLRSYNSINKPLLVSYYLVSEDRSTAYGWIHNSSYWWANLYNSNDKIKQLVNEGTGATLKYADGNYVDPADKTNYSSKQFKAPGSPSELVDKYFELKHLDPGSIYSIKFFDTQGAGGEIKSLRTEAKANIFGKISVEMPSLKQLGAKYQDVAVKIERINS